MVYVKGSRTSTLDCRSIGHATDRRPSCIGNIPYIPYIYCQYINILDILTFYCCALNYRSTGQAICIDPASGAGFTLELI